MRAFIALEVPEEVRQNAAVLERDFQMDGLTLVKKDAMHITLQFLGEISEEQAEHAIQAMKKVRSAPFRLALSGLSFFSPRLIRVVFVEISEGLEELKNVYNQLSDQLHAGGVSFEQEDYTPHLTLARVKRVRDMKRLRDAIGKNSQVRLGSFEVRSIALKESTLTPIGPVYRNLYELKL